MKFNQDIVAACLGLSWSDGATTSLGEREGTEHTASFEVPDGEHVSFVIGYTGWYVDNLSFILSNGKILGKLYYKYDLFILNI